MSWSPRAASAWSSSRQGEHGLDPVDLLILDEAADALTGAPHARSRSHVAGVPPPVRDRRVRLVVVGDRSGELSFAAADRFDATEVRIFQDECDAEQRLDALAAKRAADPALPLHGVRRFGLEPGLVEGATLVVGRLPKHHAELEELVGLIADHADERVRYVGGGRVKHMSTGLNDVLERGFTSVRASLGRQKARVLHAAGPRRDHDIAPFPRWSAVDELGIEVAAHGGAFAGPKLDIGTRALIDVLGQALEASGLDEDADGSAVDLGCGTGLLAVALAGARPRMRVLASDRSWAACESARATVTRAGLGDRITVIRDNAAASIPDASVDLVLLNPPFHDGAGLDDDAAEPLFAAAARILRPHGSLITVFNAHLPHRTALRRIVGTTELLARTPKFVVTRSIASGSGSRFAGGPSRAGRGGARPA